jgi:RNase adaptor protein for sRNA GlmZ degradation
MWVPCGMVNSNTDKLSSVLAKLERKGVTPGDAVLFMQALETKLMEKRKQKRRDFGLVFDSLGGSL